MAGLRAPTLYRQDAAGKLRFSHENEAVQTLYRDYLGEPMSERAEALLHTDHAGWQMPFGNN